MEQTSILYTSIDTRYYQFLMLSFEEPRGVEKVNDFFSNQCIKKGVNKVFSSPQQEIVNFQIKSDTRYSYAEDRDFSLKGDGKKPFVYEVVTVSFRIEEKAYLLVLFPFVFFAKDMTYSLLKIRGQNVGFNFAFINQDDSISLSREGRFKLDSMDKLNIVNLNMAIVDDPHVASLKISGRDPIRSRVFEKLIDNSETQFLPQKLVLSGQVKTNSLNLENYPSTRLLRAKVHTDAYGNYRFYIHRGGANIPVLFYIFKSLFENNLVKESSSNPLDRYIEEN